MVMKKEGASGCNCGLVALLPGSWVKLQLSICCPQVAVESAELICGVFRDHYSNPLGATRV